MSKKIVVKPEAIGPFTVVVDVFGPKIDAKGNETKHVDPKNHVQIEVHDNRLAKDGGSVPGALNKLRTFTLDSKGKKIYDPLPFYKILSVVDHGKSQQTFLSTDLDFDIPTDAIEEAVHELRDAMIDMRTLGISAEDH